MTPQGLPHFSSKREGESRMPGWERGRKRGEGHNSQTKAQLHGLRVAGGGVWPRSPQLNSWAVKVMMERPCRSWGASQVAAVWILPCSAYFFSSSASHIKSQSQSKALESSRLQDRGKGSLPSLWLLPPSPGHGRGRAVKDHLAGFPCIWLYPKWKFEIFHSHNGHIGCLTKSEGFSWKTNVTHHSFQFQMKINLLNWIMHFWLNLRQRETLKYWIFPQDGDFNLYWIL